MIGKKKWAHQLKLLSQVWSYFQGPCRSRKLEEDMLSYTRSGKVMENYTICLFNIYNLNDKNHTRGVFHAGNGSLESNFKHKDNCVLNKLSGSI